VSGELEIVNDFSAHIQPRQRRWQRGTTKIGDFPFVKGAESDPATAGRTGLAATMRVYGARGSAEAMIARVRRMHDGVAGTTSIGRSHRANNPKTAIQFLEHRREIYVYASRAHVNNSTNCNRIHSRYGRGLHFPPTTWKKRPVALADVIAAARDCGPRLHGVRREYDRRHRYDDDR
jgi:ER-bound oxygenase mpaB/B'/Rubber oxygenase, catalytic domain